MLSFLNCSQIPATEPAAPLVPKLPAGHPLLQRIQLRNRVVHAMQLQAERENIQPQPTPQPAAPTEQWKPMPPVVAKVQPPPQLPARPSFVPVAVPQVQAPTRVAPVPVGFALADLHTFNRPSNELPSAQFGKSQSADRSARKTPQASMAAPPPPMRIAVPAGGGQRSVTAAPTQAEQW